MYHGVHLGSLRIVDPDGIQSERHHGGKGRARDTAPVPRMGRGDLHVGIYVGRVPDSRGFLREFCSGQ